MYKYPYGDSQQLNLDWILAKLKELEAAGLGLDLEDVSKALISLPYNTSTAYRRYDYAFLNGKLYRCLTDTTGAFDPAAWQEALIGDDLAVLTRWINAIDAAAVVDVKFDTSGTNGKIQQKYHDEYHDVVEVDYTPVQNSKRPLSSNAGYELTTTKRISTLSDLDTSVNHFVQFNANINVGGITFPEFSKGVLVTNGGTDATIYAIDVLTGSLFTADRLSGTWRHGRNINTEISNLNGALTLLQNDLAIIVNGKQSATGASKGQYVIVKNSTISGIVDGIYVASNAIPANTNIDASYLTAISNGALNSLYADNAGLTATIIANSTYCEITQQTCKYFPASGMKVLQLQFHTTDAVPATMPSLATLPEELEPSTVVVTNLTDTNNNVEDHAIARVQNGNRMIQAREAIPTNLYLSMTVCYF